MRKKLLFLIASLITIVLNVASIYAEHYSHPPSYEQIKEALSKGQEMNAPFFNALQFSDDDIRLLEKENNIDFIIAVACQINRSKAIELMARYLPEIRKNPIYLSLFVIYAINEEEIKGSINAKQLCIELIGLSPDNGFSYLMMAYYYAKANNHIDCIAYIKRALDCPNYDNYRTEFIKNLITASCFIGYSKVAAQLYTLGFQHDLLSYFRITDLILSNTSDANDIYLCKKLGSTIKMSGTTILYYEVSTIIQKKSLQLLANYKNAEKELQSIADYRAKRDTISKSFEKILRSYDIPEKRMEKYFDDLYGISELYAMEELIQEFPLSN